jgi:hypothetical protein
MEYILQLLKRVTINNTDTNSDVKANYLLSKSAGYKNINSSSVFINK